MTVLSVITLTSTATAQVKRWLDTTLPAVKPTFRFSDSTFIIGSMLAGPSEHPDTLWPFADSLGLNLVQAGDSAIAIDNLLTSLKRGNKLMIVGDDKATPLSWSQEIQFYLFDRDQSPIWRCRFATKQDGHTVNNSIETEPNNQSVAAKEQWFESGYGTAGDTIAQHITYDWNSAQVNRYGGTGIPDSTVQNSSAFVDGDVRFADIDTNDYVVVTGHIFSSGSGSSNTTVLLELDVVYEMPQGSIYYDAGGSQHTVTGPLETLIDTFKVTKGDLFPVDTITFDKYRERAFPVNLKRCLNGQSGPRDSRSTSHRFDVRVRWTGAGKVAIRSISLRDRLAQRLIGMNDTSQAYRQSVINSAKRVVLGPSWATDTSHAPRDGIFRFFVKEEPTVTEYGGFEFLNRMFRDSFYLAKSVGQRLPAFTAQTASLSPTTYRHYHSVTSSEDVVPELAYPSSVIDTVAKFPGDIGPHNDAVSWMANHGLTRHTIPSLKQHNGGRFHLPLLELNIDSVANYTRMVQFGLQGRYMPGQDYALIHGPWYFQNTSVNMLGTGAGIARDSGRRLISVPGIATFIATRAVIDSIHTTRVYDSLHGGDSVFHYHYDTVAAHLDTLASHQQEASEMRLNANLTLCYGGTGIISYWLMNYTHVLGYTPRSIAGHDYWEGVQDSFGPIDEDGDYSQNRMRLLLRTHPGAGRVPKDTINDFYAGFHNRISEFQWLNKEWLPRVGGEMLRHHLRWRDGYSVSLQQLRPGGTESAIQPRPLPLNEIITSVTARAPRDTIVDPPYETFVELGMFYTKPGAGNVLSKDTNLVFCVNRRTFERPADVLATSDSGKFMDALAETREIKLKFNLQQATLGQYQWIRVREIQPDTTPLPGQTTARVPLNVIIPADGTASITLGPARAALLEITYMLPDESIVTGKLDYNNQRKMIYWNHRYFATYYRTAWEPPTPGGKAVLDSQVYFRRSIPVDSTGVILWEPVETLVSLDYGDPLRNRTKNAHPSLTLRPINGDTAVATIVWTAHAGGADTLHREVALRNIYLADTTVVPGHIEHVDDYYYLNPLNPGLVDPTVTWGTPVICRLDSGYAICYSDAKVGILAMIRKMDSGPAWWQDATVTSYSTRDTVHKTTAFLGVQRFPTVPTFAHIINHDASCGVAWEQPMGTGVIGYIYYKRLTQFPPLVPGGAPRIAKGGVYSLTVDAFGNAHNPSMDQTQDLYGRIQDVVVWEEYASSPWYPLIGNNLCVRSIYTPASGPTQLWGFNKWFAAGLFGSAAPIRANVSSLNDLCGVADDGIMKAFFGITYSMSDVSYQAKFRYTEDFYNRRIREYTFGGEPVTGSASPERQVSRHGVLYETTEGGTSSVLRTSREFFARIRPDDYVAQGRAVSFALADSMAAGASILMYDPWIATDSISQPLILIARDSTYRFTDSLSQVHDLLRTENFTVHDSVQIGMKLGGILSGDTIALGSAVVSVVAELVKASTGAVVKTLDSFAITRHDTLHVDSLSTVYDLLSNTYYIRVRLDTSNVYIRKDSGDSKYVVAEVSGEVGDAFGKLSALRGESGAKARISAQPNPFGTSTEVRFSIPRRDYGTVTVYDRLGRKVAVLVENILMDAGRYAVELNGSTLQPGSYIVELKTSSERVVGKLVVVR